MILRARAAAFAAVFMLLGSVGQAGADVAWAPFPVEVWERPFDMDGPRRRIDYMPLDRAEKAWHLCVAIPHVKDSYWLAVNYGLVEESERLDVRMTLKEAGGYANFARHRRQVRECVDGDHDALIVGAVSYHEQNDLVAAARAAGKPVIDLVNGMSSRKLTAKSLVSFREMAARAGAFLREHADGPARIAWFPGPEGAGWVEDGDAGLRAALAGSEIEIVGTAHGDTTPKAQRQLLETFLEEDREVDYIVGTAVTATQAAELLAEKGLSRNIQVVAYYLTQNVYQELKRGRILAAPTDSPVVQARIAVDLAVRALEGKPYLRHLGPELYVVDRVNVNFFEYQTALAPPSFTPVHRVPR